MIYNWPSKLSDVVGEYNVRKMTYDKLISNVDDTEGKIPIIAGFINESKHNTDKQNLEKKIEVIDKENT